MAEPIRLLWLHTGANGGCGAYRAIIPALTLNTRGYRNDALWNAQIKELTPKALRRLTRDVDVVVFQRCIGNVFLDLIDHYQSIDVATIVELDDDLFHLPRTNPSGPFYRTKGVQTIIRESLRRCDHVIVSTPPLRDAIADEVSGVRPDKITVAYNHLHQSMWGEDVLSQVTPKPLEGKVIIGWQGSGTHDTDFGIVVPALRRILSVFPQTRLRFFGYVPVTIRGKIDPDRFDYLHAVPLGQYPCTLKQAAFDIGLAPLTDCAFNRAKSNVRFLDQSACRIPTVASRVYPYARSIDHGRTGFLASTEQEWYEALAALVVDPDLRQRIRDAAYDEVWKLWSADTRIGAWETALAKAVGKRRAALGV